VHYPDQHWRSWRTKDDGTFAFEDLQPGKYTVSVTAKGFAPATQEVEIAAGQEKKADIALEILVKEENIEVQSDAAKVSTASDNNASSVVLSGKDLDALSDDPDELQSELQALAGPSAGPNGGQIYIDGFTGGRLPPKQSIREVRINSNPFASQFDRPGQGRIEIFTKPGTDEFHGQLVFQFSDAALNARNPFVDSKPAFQRRQWEGEFSGPVNKKTSFFFDFERKDVNENVFINAYPLDSNLQATHLQQAVVTPVTGVELNLKVDRQLTKNHTLTADYGYARDNNDNQGIGGFSLAGRAFANHDAEDTWRVAETGVLNVHTVNETRFRYRRQRTNQNGTNPAFTVNVLDAFTDGGSPQLVAFNHQDRFEAQNFTTLVHGAHNIRWGGLVRGISESDRATQNYAGTFTFTSIDSYRLTLLGLRNRLTGGQIRASGGGASQFTISGGDPLASIGQADFGFFLQDDWKLRPNFTISGGLRYETQTHTKDRLDFGPRIGFAWGVGKPKGKTSKNVIRGGFGIFYDRLSESLTLDARRLDGIHQQQFVIPFPDFYPDVPAVQTLAGSAQPQAIRKTDSQWRAPMMVQGAMAFERQLPKNITLSTNYIHSRGVRVLRSRNINAALPGTGAHPFGGVNSIYFYETSGVFRQNQVITSVNAKVSPKLTISGSYTWGRARSNADGAGTFPANQYDLSSEYGRAGFDIRHRGQVNGSVSLPWQVRLNPFLTVTSGRPYNVTLGRDLNGDSLYTDRPAYATDLARTSVVMTSFGPLDAAPLPGQTILPRNYGNSAAMVAANLRISKTLTLGEGGGGKKPAGDPRQLTFTLNGRNFINHPNLGNPNGNLSSPTFGRATGLAGGQGSTRRLDLQVRFDF
jgi:hypothetical protein